VQLKGFQELTPINDALDRFFKKLQPKKLETLLISVEDALGRVVAKNIIAERHLPSFNRSAMDGYALKAEDTAEASQFKPRAFRLVKKKILEEGEAMEIWTGNVLPKGADTVVMLEHTKKIGGQIEVLTPLTPGSNVSRKGEDVKKGETRQGVGSKSDC